jgi:hypothetical protein
MFFFPEFSPEDFPSVYDLVCLVPSTQPSAGCLGWQCEVDTEAAKVCGAAKFTNSSADREEKPSIAKAKESAVFVVSILNMGYGFLENRLRCSNL